MKTKEQIAAEINRLHNEEMKCRADLKEHINANTAITLLDDLLYINELETDREVLEWVLEDD